MSARVEKKSKTAEQPGPLASHGKVVAVSRCQEHGFAKQPRPSIALIAGEGVKGDSHRGVTVQHLYKVRRDATQLNLCQVHLFASEMLDELRGHGYDLGPGEIGENILTSGIELLNLPKGTILRVGSEAVLEVTGLRTPCSQIDGYRAGLQKHLWGERDGKGKRTRRAGVMSVVLTAGSVLPNDLVMVEIPQGPPVALGPV